MSRLVTTTTDDEDLVGQIAQLAYHLLDKYRATVLKDHLLPEGEEVENLPKDDKYPAGIVLANQDAIVAGEMAAGNRVFVGARKNSGRRKEDGRYNRHCEAVLQEALGVSPPPTPRLEQNLRKCQASGGQLFTPQGEDPSRLEPPPPASFRRPDNATADPMAPLQPVFRRDTPFDDDLLGGGDLLGTTGGHVSDPVALLEKAKVLRQLIVGGPHQKK